MLNKTKRKCKFCKHYAIYDIPDWVGLLEEDVPFCRVKEKRINPNWIKPFCKYFMPKEKE